MKALVLAERSDTARALAAGARLMADDVVLVAIANLKVE
ncbi:MAG: electron transfer flavoprotein subunit alpha/FixB family protein, partial [Gordonibacter sp.]